MAGYVKVQRSIWTDPDFVALRGEDQRVYMLLISQPDISHVGVLPLTPGRWSGLDATTTTKQLRASLDRLAAARFVIISDDTEELLVRSYILHDEAYKIPNGKKALTAAYEKVISAQLRIHIATAMTTVGVTLDGTQAGTVEEPQQPAASNQHTEPAAAAAATPPDRDAAAAAIEAYIVYRVNRATTNPKRLDEKLRAEVPEEYGEQLRAYLARKPAADERELLRRVFLLNAQNVMTALVEYRQSIADERSA